MRSKLAIILFGLTLAAFCQACAKHALVESHDLALPSGEHVTISDAHGDSFTDVNGVKRPIFYVSYRTTHAIDDIPSLRKEALRVWAAYKPQIVGVDYDTCAVTPMKQTTSGAEAGRPFYLFRAADGTWALAQ